MNMKVLNLGAVMKGRNPLRPLPLSSLHVTGDLSGKLKVGL